MGWGSLLGAGIGAAGSIGGALLGGGGSSDSADAALKWQKKVFRIQMQKMQEQLAREEPFRLDALARADFGVKQFPTLQNYLDNPTMSPGFQLAQKTGVDALRSEYSTTGSPSSGPAQVAGAKFTEGLANDELNRFSDNLFRAAGFQGNAQQSQAPGILGLATDTSKDISNLYQNQGATNASMYKTIGDTLGQFGMLAGNWWDKKYPSTSSATSTVAPFSYQPPSGSMFDFNY